MTKKQLARATAASTGHLSRQDAHVLVDTLFGAMAAALQAGERIEIRGFGTLRTKMRAARLVTHPKDGTKRHVTAKRVTMFVASPHLAARLDPAAAPVMP